MSGTITCDANKITTWSSGDYLYTKTDTYIVSRGGTMDYNMIPVDGSTHFADDIMNSIEPFDYGGLIDFSHSYLSGFLAEKYDVDSNTASTIALSRAQNSTSEILKSDIKGYTSISIREENLRPVKTKNEYVLLPVWLLNVKYKDKLYTFAMNGQTGKIVGNVPVDVKRTVAFAIFTFLAVALIITAIWYFTGV